MNKEKIYIGVMTGTSLDAIDVCSVKFDIESSQITPIAFNSYSFKSLYKSAALRIINNIATIREISQFISYVSDQISDSINNHIKIHNLDKFRIEAVGVHGQTVWHEPSRKTSFQAVSGPLIAIATKLPVVYDFRAYDIANGGEGAPLVPILDFHFFSEHGIDTIILNIGGVSNITYIPKNSNIKEIIAFDTGPGNILIDLAVSNLFGLNYDIDGKIAAKGHIIENLLDSLMNDKFVNSKFPKSCGREIYNMNFLQYYKIFDYDKYDVVSTLTEYTAKSIAKNIEMLVNENSDYVLKVSGGGVHNKILMERVSHYVNTDIIKKISLSGKDITDSKEAILMAFLAYLRINNLPGNIPSVTGASKTQVLGSIALP